MTEWGERWHGIELGPEGPGTRMDDLLPPERLAELGELCEAAPSVETYVTDDGMVIHFIDPCWTWP